MDFDFSLILTAVTLLAAVICLADKLFFKQHKSPKQLAQYEGKEYKEHIIIEYAYSFFPVLAIVWVLRSFLFEPFTIPSGSMLPTLEVGDYILVNKYTYGLRLPVVGTEILAMNKPQRGEVMVFKFPPKPSMNFIKRVVGLPGDKIKFKNDTLYINGQAVQRELIKQEPAVQPWEQYFREVLGSHIHLTRQEVGSYPAGKEWSITVPEGHYFMMGDNRDNSNDSRFWGPVPEANIVGRAVYVWTHKEPGFNLPSFHRNGAIN
ncbi:signal peptidase I [Agitococcus lubricus]|uniref:Signal peptidase I n=1 Tax=Agitococcus lubricus TaxID=1077255 RepID=A0A2T5J064_9GAMM|nr:signal peptidase I [Agitococcus lubricus]PTQ89729.1 signal peptidase I [Agitococcus lubricus]